MRVVKLLLILLLIKSLALNALAARVVVLVSPDAAARMMLNNLRVLTWCMQTAARVAFGRP